MPSHINLVKLSVGTESIDDMLGWQQQRASQSRDGQYYHVTRMWPKREAELLDGGSIYWVIKGVIQCRQRILELREVIGQDDIRRCGIVLAPEIIRTASTPKKAFQGWRYLSPADAPGDLTDSQQAEDSLPPELQKALAALGVR
ncbi:hypothetical protein SAMN04488004_11665 [Loktanella salsilacus]|uniref:DUF1489 domain-containing protein n=1 Tax=Loktanella salsilacus TaxID=195913 RepID=A0A1I4HAG2_9RHOB|nr:DUF1489 domain-containing protein [Loktanella salsilacus]MBU0781337.1 DUF1489 domain-containing protein [Alphaproteobacteria bacterium]MBU1837854.1 DUF1489 domain-containing protein [Alphaproteobacteria bacterium]UTH48631.1 DUF1489 domain-containing protein [Loktanella salsilacus]SFL38436.1 hypothetical protein SAMN04488004_11665 [Loktanella salsilacus]